MTTHIFTDRTKRFLGFCVQPGMLYGYSNDSQPYISKLAKNNETVLIRRIKGRKDSQNVWDDWTVCTDDFICQEIKNKAIPNGVNYLSAEQREAEGWEIYKEKNNGSVLKNGHNSKYYYINQTRNNHDRERCDPCYTGSGLHFPKNQEQYKPTYIQIMIDRTKIYQNMALYHDIFKDKFE